MILVSACLAGKHCRWDGGTNLVPEIKDLVDNGLAVTACPEVLGGMSTPRKPSERQGARVVNREGEDVTAAFWKGAEEALRICREHGCCIAVLKAKSPSCGKGLIHNGLFDGGLISGNGIAAQLLMDCGIEVLTEEEWLASQKSPQA
ncbi:MAG: DUF523 domain-containing protein [Oscillospiraceae bacterium]|nr:DUF523 domain-containing protein [Oscillospiraceae bacterium]